MLPAVRPLGRDARRQLLRMAWSKEAARLRARAAKKTPAPEPGAPTPVDDELPTVAIAYESMSALVHGERKAA